MKRDLQVYVGNDARLVGTLHYDLNGSREQATFVYDEAWLADADAFARVCGHRAGRLGTAGYSARLCEAAKRGETRGSPVRPGQLNALDFLLAVADGSRVGALRFRDEAGVFQHPRAGGCYPRLRASSSRQRTARAVQPVWWLAPTPRPLSPWKYS